MFAKDGTGMIILRNAFGYKFLFLLVAYVLMILGLEKTVKKPYKLAAVTRFYMWYMV